MHISKAEKINQSMKRFEKTKKIRNEVKEKIHDLDNKTIGTRIIIEEALKRASLYKSQKVLLMIEISSKLNDGELD